MIKRLWSLAMGLSILLVGPVNAAQAETVALNFEVDTALEIAANPQSTLTLPPPTPPASPPQMTSSSIPSDPVVLTFAPDPMLSVPDAILPGRGSTDAPALTGQFAPPPSPTPSSPPTITKSSAPLSVYPLSELFTGGSHSLVAKAVGNAEGTRTPSGGYTAAYNGHTDPGNGVWNLGTFSYQHGASSATEADAKQLQRLQAQAQELRRQAAAKQITLTLREELNGIDLANQAPKTALDRGYIKWLERAHQLPMTESDRIVWARTRSFIHPDTGRWNAPGLGNTLESVTRDQRRRQQAIEQVL